MNSQAASSYAQFIIVLLIFVFVLAVTFFVTKWTAGFQKTKGNGSNIELIESAMLTSNKHIQIVRIGNKYVALAVSKDNVTVITELDEEELVISSKGDKGLSFKDIMSKVRNGSGITDSYEGNGTDEN